MKIMRQFSSTAGWKSNGLTDGRLTILYRDIPGIFEKIKIFFVERDIGPGNFLALECENSVPGALILLYLLEEGYSFLLLPVVKNPSPGPGQSVPGLCRYKIGTENQGLNPAQFLHISRNEKWMGESLAASGEPKLCMRTSGSTGAPKMAVHSHTLLEGNVLNCVKRLRLSSRDRIAIPVPIFHMFGLGAAFLPGAAAGAWIDLQKGANILRYLQREKEFNPNVAFMTPVFSEILLKGRRSPRPYRLTVVAGDRLRGDTFTKYESLFGCLVQLYGSTEMGAVTSANPDDPVAVRGQTAGKPMSDVQIRLEKGRGEDVGELWCHHKYGFQGYVDETGKPTGQDMKKQGGWFCTRDLGRIRPDGCLEILGRSDHSVNRDGLLVFFSDIEKAIVTIEAIETAVVVSRGESQRGKRIIAFCVTARGVNISEKDIQASCFDILPRHAVPDNIVIIKSLPLLPNGKVDRQKLIGMLDLVDAKDKSNEKP